MSQIKILIEKYFRKKNSAALKIVCIRGVVGGIITSLSSKNFQQISFR